MAQRLLAQATKDRDLHSARAADLDRDLGQALVFLAEGIKQRDASRSKTQEVSDLRKLLDLEFLVMDLLVDLELTHDLPTGAKLTDARQISSGLREDLFSSERDRTQMVREREVLQQKLQAASAEHSAALQRLAVVASVVSGAIPPAGASGGVTDVPPSASDAPSGGLGARSQPDPTPDQHASGASVPVSTPAPKPPKHPRSRSASPAATTPSRRKLRRLDPASSPEQSPVPLDRAEPIADQPKINDDGVGSPDPIHRSVPPADPDPVGGSTASRAQPRTGRDGGPDDSGSSSDSDDLESDGPHHRPGPSDDDSGSAGGSTPDPSTHGPGSAPLSSDEGEELEEQH